MNTDFSFFYQTPIQTIGIVIFILLLVATEIGYRFGYRQRKLWKNADTGGGTVALSSTFALLGLILAFTYAASVNRFDDRKQAVVDEANALSTAFLRADLIDKPEARELKEKILAYARTRTVKSDGIISNEERKVILNNTLNAQKAIWPVLKSVIRDDKPGPIEASLVTAINDVLDIHTIRVKAIFDKIPVLVIWIMIFISAATLAVAGFNAGISGKISRWWTATLSLVMTFVISTIQDFDRPGDGFIQVSNQSIVLTINEMEANLALERKHQE